MDSKKAFLLRVDSRLWRELERWAADELRSVNGQVEWILREAVRRRSGPSGPKPGHNELKGRNHGQGANRASQHGSL